MRLERLTFLPIIAALRSAGIAALLAAGVAAQGVGSPMPREVALEDFTQTQARSYEDYFGRAVLIEFFAYWCDPCGAQVPHLNELQATYGDKGLSVVGVTHEDAASTEKWIEAKGARYAYAYDPAKRLSRFFGVRGIPHAVLIDPGGMVVWKGHPAELEAKHVEAALEGALPRPIFEWPAAASGARNAMARRQFARAIAALEELGPEGEELLRPVKAMVEREQADMAAALSEGNYLEAQEIATALAQGLAGTPGEEQARGVLDQIRSDRATAAIIKAQRRIRELRLEPIPSAVAADKIMAELDKLARQVAGTYAARQATELLYDVRQARAGFGGK